MSKHFFDLKPGDKLAIKGPILKFEYKSASSPVSFSFDVFAFGDCGRRLSSVALPKR